VCLDEVFSIVVMVLLLRRPVQLVLLLLEGEEEEQGRLGVCQHCLRSGWGRSWIRGSRFLIGTHGL
jgi:hypothetical protein